MNVLNPLQSLTEIGSVRVIIEALFSSLPLELLVQLLTGVVIVGYGGLHGEAGLRGSNQVVVESMLVKLLAPILIDVLER